jgi:hypothetical protein
MIEYMDKYVGGGWDDCQVSLMIIWGWKCTVLLYG